MSISPAAPRDFTAWLDAEEMGLPEDVHDFESLDNEAALRGLAAERIARGPGRVASGSRPRAPGFQGRDHGRLRH
jgi:hypothetical protein